MTQFDLIFNILNQKGVGRVKANKILQTLESLLDEGWFNSVQIYNELLKFFSHDQIDEILTKTTAYKQHEKGPSPFFLSRFHPLFPNYLKELKSNCPPILSCIGNVDLLKERKVGFCGSRNASEKGLNVAKDVSQQVVKKGLVTVSGYASGIDQEAHYWSLKEGGATILVLPEGIDHFSIKKYLEDVWDWKRVLVISEFEPNAIWSVNRAMQRNSSLVALSDALFLIEARVKGGSIDAGNKALQMGKPLFAPVYQGMPDEAAGNQILLSKGAFPLMRKRENNKANLDKMMSLIFSSDFQNHTLFA